MKNIVIKGVAALLLPIAAQAQQTTLAGWTFSQFLGQGAPSVNGQNFESVDSIVATYRGNINPVSAQVDGIIVGQQSGTGYTDPTIGTWSFSSFNINDGVDVIADSAGVNTLNATNSTTLDGKQMHLTDSQGMMLTFNGKNKLWSIQVNNTAGYTNASGADFTFAARGNGGNATVEWLFDSTVFATTTVTSGSFESYQTELPVGFYGNGQIQGRLTAGSAGTVSFDNVQVNASAVPEPSSFAAIAGIAGLALASSRRRRSSS